MRCEFCGYEKDEDGTGIHSEGCPKTKSLTLEQRIRFLAEFRKGDEMARRGEGCPSFLSAPH